MTDQGNTPGEMPAAPVADTTNAQPPASAPTTAEMATELEKTRAALKAANKEAADRRKRLEELETAETKRKESEMSEVDKLKKALAEKEAILTSLQRATLQRQAAEKVGLPAVFADRLKGETPDELEADAKAILEALPKAQQPKGNPTNPGANATGGETDTQRLATHPRTIRRHLEPNRKCKDGRRDTICHKRNITFRRD